MAHCQYCAKGQRPYNFTPASPCGTDEPHGDVHAHTPPCLRREVFFHPTVSLHIYRYIHITNKYIRITSRHIMKHRQRFLTPRFLMSLFFLIATAALAVKFYLRGDYPLGIIFAIFACYCIGAMVDHFFMPGHNDGDRPDDGRDS